MGRPKNLKEVILLRRNGIPAHVANGDFLDAFYAAPIADKQLFLNTEPSNTEGMDITVSSLAQYASIAEKLAHDFDLEVPEWVNKDIYFLSSLHLAGKPACEYPDELIECLLEETPIEFRRRNLIVSENILERR